ncbi:hypothetical protein [Lacibacter sp. H407]|jgi:hypothetical protein|uniref:hypothetical protein n=1 Tax=Lacibacter sp. H407 TaxID=3133423 RepID=UPI0030C15BF4
MKSILVIFLLSCNYLYAQKFKIDPGVSIHSGFGQLNRYNETLPVHTVFGGFLFFPRYIFKENNNASLSIGIPLSIGLGESEFSSTNKPLAVDIPLTIDYNFGKGATRDSDKKRGVFLGAGFNYTLTKISAVAYTTPPWDESDFNYLNSYGVLVHGGVRFRILQIRLSYAKSFSEGKFNFFSAGLLGSF